MIKVAFFDLTDCEGCELQFLQLKEKLIALFKDFEIENWRLLLPNNEIGNYDVAIITGTPVKPEEVELLKLIRSRTKYLVAIGYCAVAGGIQGWVKLEERKKLTEYVYGKNYKPRATEAKALSAYVKVDKEIPGCPAEFKALENLIKKIPELTQPSKIPLPPTECRLVPDYLAKIEGHGTLNINFKEKEARLEVEEGERLIEGLLLGRNFDQAPYVTSRICGICPVAHNLAAIKALENIFEIRPNEIVVALRKILLYGQIIHSHLLHLFFLSLPDYLGFESGIGLADACPKEFRVVINLKRVAEKMLETIGGRVVHPTNTTLGGFLRLPTKRELRKLSDELKKTVEDAERLAKIFLNLNYPKLERKTEYLALLSENNYGFYGSDKVVSSRGSQFNPQDYRKEIKEEVKPYSTAKIGRRSKGGFMVGALARLNLFQNHLNPKAKQLLGNSKITPPTYNSFHNNPAQAIEILHLYEESINLLGGLISTKDSVYQKAGEKMNFKVKATSGVGYLEAPRGTLYHFYEIDAQGKIKNCDIVTPTVQNLSNIEGDAGELLTKTCKLPKKECIKQVEMLIRAYDPCITCSVH